jgi:hypothetical protein
MTTPLTDAELAEIEQRAALRQRQYSIMALGVPEGFEELTETRDIRALIAEVRRLRVVEVRYERMVAALEKSLGLETGDDAWSDVDTMPRVGGKSFRCDCGGNVFRKHKTLSRFQCNSCLAEYVGS